MSFQCISVTDKQIPFYNSILDITFEEFLDAEQVKKPRKNKNKPLKEFDVFGSGESKSFTTGQTQYDDNLPNTYHDRTNTYQADSTTSSLSYVQKKHCKRLYESKNDKNHWDVCEGLADFFGIDTNWALSFFAAVFIIAWGSCLLIYMALSLILNKEPLDLD